MIHEVVGWKRITVDGTVMPYRHRVRFVSGASSSDDGEATRLFLGKLQNVSVDGVDYTPRATMDIIGATASADDDTLAVQITQPDPWYTREIGTLSYDNTYADLSEIVIPNQSGLYVLHAVFRYHDTNDPSHVGYHDSLWGVIRDGLGVLHVTSSNSFGGAPLAGAREGMYGISDTIVPYYGIAGSTIRFGAAIAEEFFEEYQVSCDARIAVVPRVVEAEMAFWTGWLGKIGSTFIAAIPGLNGVLLAKSDSSPDIWQSNGSGAAKVSLVEEASAVAGVNISAITVSSPSAAAIASTRATPRGIRVWSPDGTGGSTANTDDIGIGYSDLTAANCTEWLQPGDFADIDCADIAEVYALSATASQTLRVEVR